LAGLEFSPGRPPVDVALPVVAVPPRGAVALVLLPLSDEPAGFPSDCTAPGPLPPDELSPPPPSVLLLGLAASLVGVCAATKTELAGRKAAYDF